MTFAAPLALLALGFGLLIALAHALFRGKKKPLFFPAMRFADAHTETSSSERKLEDRSLLLVRLLLLGAVVLLGASPFLACEGLGLERKGNEPMSVALIIDDSASMKIELDGRSRFEIARRAALELVKSARSDDLITLILAGAPARTLIQGSGGSRELTARLEALQPTDRGTDLRAALLLGEQLLANSGRTTRSLVVLSDGATPELDEPLENVEMPLPELRTAAKNCAVDAARLRTHTLRFQVNCTEPSALAGRKVEIITLPSRAALTPEGGASLSSEPAHEGSQSVTLPEGKKGPFAIRLTKSKSDQLADDDFAFVADEANGKVLVLAGGAVGRTSSTPLLELALSSLERPLEIVPGISLFSAKNAADYAAVIIEDPAGFSEEDSQALEAMVRGGGVALALFGPNITRAPLGHGAHPFLSSVPRLEPLADDHLLLSDEIRNSLYATWEPLGAKRRVTPRLDPDHSVTTKFQDGTPLLFERKLGAGLVVATTVPSSETESDLALRPAFLALLGRVLDEALLRKTRETVVAGTALPVRGGEVLRGTEGPVEDAEGAPGSRRLERARLYELVGPAGKELRSIERPRGETVERPRSPSTSIKSVSERHVALFDISRELAALALFFGALELVLRSRRGEKRRRAASSPSATVSAREGA